MFNVLIVIFPYFNAAATSAFIDPFRVSNYLCGESRFHWELVSMDGGSLLASNGMQLDTQPLAPARDSKWDLVVVSSSWAPEDHHSPALQGALRNWAAKGRRGYRWTWRRTIFENGSQYIATHRSRQC